MADYLAELKRSIKLVTGNDDYYFSLCKLLYLLADKKDKEEITKVLQEKENEYQELLLQGEEFQEKNVRHMNQLKHYHEIFRNEKTVKKEFLELQKYFLQYLEKKIKKVVLKEEMLSIIYMLRYYKNCLLFENRLIKENKKLYFGLETVMKLAITKACNMGILRIVCMDIQVNFEILNYILDTKIMNLQDIKIYVECQEDELLVAVYDKEVFEKQGKIKFSGNKKDIIIRKKRNVNLFY